MKNKKQRFIIAVLISFLMAIGITRCHAQDVSDSQIRKMVDSAAIIQDGQEIATSNIGTLFGDNGSLIKYIDGHWGKITDSLNALNMVFDKYSETLSNNRGFRTMLGIQRGIINDFMKLRIEDHTKQEEVDLLKSIVEGMKLYDRLNKIYFQ